MTRFRATAALGDVLRTLFGNLGPAVRLSWPWMAIYAVIQFAVVLALPDALAVLLGKSPDPLKVDPSAWIAVMFLLCFSTVGFSSIAVNWHRFILRGEEARGASRLRMDGVVLRYIGNVFLGMLIVLPVFFATMIAAIILWMSVISCCLATSEPSRIGAVSFSLALLPSLVPLVILQRLFVKLPAIALARRGYTFGKAWRDSAGHNLRLAGFVAMIMILTFGIGWIANIPLVELSTAFDNLSPVGLVLGASWQVVVNWIGWIVGINAITILYSIFAEGREN